MRRRFHIVTNDINTLLGDILFSIQFESIQVVQYH